MSHQMVIVEGEIEVCDTCVNSLGYQVAWGQTTHQQAHDPEPQPGDGPDYHAEHAYWLSRQPFAEMVEHSSLGTPSARALRGTVSDERVAAIVERAAALGSGE